MHPFDLKKLITGFLILSVLSGGLTLVVLNFTDKKTPSPLLGLTGAQTQNPLSIGKNAFVEQLPQNSFAQANSQAAMNQNLIQPNDQPTDTSNLTRNFSRIFAQQVIAHNPDGPQLDENGKSAALNLPDENSAAVLIQQAITSSTFAVDEKIPDSDIKILATYAANDAGNYFKAIKSVLEDFVSSTARIDTTNPSSMPETIAISQLIFESTYQKLSATPVPQPLAGFHRSMLQFFANQKKVFEVAGNYQVDPLKTIIVLQNEKQIIDKDVKNIQDNIQNISKELSYYPKANQTTSLISNFFGIKKAYAAAAIVEDLLAIAQRLGQFIQTAAKWAWDKADSIAKWAYTTALRIAVKILIDTFQNQVVNWIAGNGNPKFITDWKGFLTEVADKAAGQAISGIYPFLCSGIGPLIRIAVLPVPSLDTSVRCTLTQVIQNVQNFYDSFQNGGWIAYGATLQPQNNFFGGLIIANDAVVRAAANAQDAAKNQAVASQGFLSITKKTGKCLKSHEEDQVDELGISRGTKTVCDQYEEIITTPGGVVGSTLTEALKWPQNQWISAQRFEELVGAIINAGINRMMREGLSALTAASNPAPTNFTNAIPAGVSDPRDISSLRSSLNDLVNLYQQNGTFQKFQDVANADGQWLALLPNVISALNQAGSSCPSLTSSAQQKIAELNSLKNNVTAEFLNASANTADSFKAKIANATSTQVLLNMTDQLQNLAGVTVDVSAAQGRLTRLQNLQANAQANLPNSCNVPLIDTSVVPPPVVAPPVLPEVAPPPPSGP